MKLVKEYRIKFLRVLFRFINLYNCISVLKGIAAEWLLEQRINKIPKSVRIHI